MVAYDQDRPLPDKLSLLTIREAIDRLRIGRSTFYQLVQDRKIPLRKIGGASRVRSDDLDAYIQNLPKMDTPEPEVW
ncbi:helix-turn-helix domain-containing protein [Brevundimonas sp. DC300-4]|uniref:helix-turn-helix domain-containing protein n=1 Tax=Brevundimonas sp. DC300-4 TaxID=2804594 RepID=UPI003CED6B88